MIDHQTGLEWMQHIDTPIDGYAFNFRDKGRDACWDGQWEYAGRYCSSPYYDARFALYEFNGNTSNDDELLIVDGAVVPREGEFAGFAGHSDWRLPTIAELLTILDCSFGNPCIDQSVFGPTEADRWYWSATSVGGVYRACIVRYVGGDCQAFAVDFADGSVAPTNKADVGGLRVRAVRRHHWPS